MPFYSASIKTARDLSVEEQIPLIAEAGFTHLSPASSGVFGPYLYVDGVRERLARLAREHGLGIDWVHLPFFQLALCSANPEDRTVALGALRDGIVQTARLQEGAAVVIHVTHNEIAPPGCSPEDCRDQLTEAFHELLATGRRVGVDVTVENLFGEHTYALVQHLLDTFPDLGLTLDTGHANVGGTLDMWLPRYAPRVRALHCQDNDGTNDQHLPPGWGTIDWPEIHRHLAAADYGGVWGNETIQGVTDFPAEPADLFADLRARMEAVATGRQPAPRPAADTAEARA
jgi:sugar phosphate isomerase/epimerase